MPEKISCYSLCPLGPVVRGLEPRWFFQLAHLALFSSTRLQGTTVQGTSTVEVDTCVRLNIGGNPKFLPKAFGTAQY